MQIARFGHPLALVTLSLSVAGAQLAACSSSDDSSSAGQDAGSDTSSPPADGGVEGSANQDAAPPSDAGAGDTSSSPDSAGSPDSAADTSAPPDASADASHDASTDAETGAPTVVPCPGGTTPTQTIMVGYQQGDNFSPTSVTIHVGDTVQWNWVASGHNVVSVANGFSCTADGTFCSPDDTSCATAPTSDVGTTYCQKFEAAGTYDFVCIPHCGFGMRGSVVVQ